MRRKSDRTANKKAKPSSPEKKLEKVKRIRTRRRKQSSSENDSVDETSQISEESESVAINIKNQTPVKTTNEETPDQVWQVKTAESSGDSGEIQKLKICLTRPPSTPERGEKSPRNKRKLRATSSSETPGSEGSDEKKKRHRSKRLNRESIDDSDRSDTQLDISSKEDSQTEIEINDHEVSIGEIKDVVKTDNKPELSDIADNHASILALEKEETSEPANTASLIVSDSAYKSQNENSKSIHNDCEPNDSQTVICCEAENSNCSNKDLETVGKTKEDENISIQDNLNISPEHIEICVVKDPCQKELEDYAVGNREGMNEEDKSSESKNEQSNETSETFMEQHANSACENVVESIENNKKSVIEQDKENESDFKTENQMTIEENIDLGDISQNEPAVPIVISRKRKWGSRVNRSNSQKSLTISTDVLKDIIPDVKPATFEEVIERKHHKRVEVSEKVEKPLLPKIVIDNSEHVETHRKESIENYNKIDKDTNLGHHRKISIIKENDVIARPPSPPKNKQSCVLYITNLVRPFTLPQLKNLLQRTGKIVEDGFWIDNIKSRCYVKYETEDQAVETRHALHGVTWPVSNPKTLQVDFSTQDSLDNAKNNTDGENQKPSTIPGTVEDWLREQDLKRERGELDKPWERKPVMREWDVGKNEKDKDADNFRKDERALEKRRHYQQERSPEPAKKFKRKEEEAPAKLLDDLFRKTKTTPCIYWLPLSAETIAIKEQQRRQHMAEYERRMQEMKRTHRRPH